MTKKYARFALAAVIYAAFAVYLYRPYFNGFGSLRFQDLFVANICLASLGAYVLSRRWIAGFAESFFAGAIYGFGPFALGLAKFHPTAGFLFATITWLFCPAVFGPSGKFKLLRVPLSLLPFLVIALYFHLAARFGLYPIPINLKLHVAEMAGLPAPLVAAKRNMTLVGFYHIPLAALIMGLSMLLVPLEGLRRGGILQRGRFLKGLAVRRLGIVAIFAVATILAFCDSFFDISPIIWLAVSVLCCSILIGAGMQGLISAGLWRGRPGLASRWHLANGTKQGQDALATWILFTAIFMGVLAIVTLLFATKYFQIFAGLGSGYARLLTEEAKMYILGAVTVAIFFFMTRAKFRTHLLKAALLCAIMGLDIFLGARFVVDRIFFVGV